VEGLDFLPAGTRRPDSAELLASNRLAELLAWAESRYDQILIDSPPGLAASDASMIGRLVDGLVLVVQPNKTQRRNVLHVVESLTALDVNLLGVVVNRINSQKTDSVYGYNFAYGYGYEYGNSDTSKGGSDPEDTLEIDGHGPGRHDSRLNDNLEKRAA